MATIYLLSNVSYEDTISLPMIDINYLNFKIDFNRYDSLVFTSKNSVLALEKEEIWRQKECYAISDQTANLLKQKDANLKFTGKSRDGNEFAKEILPLLKDKKTLYIRAKELASNLPNILRENGIDLDELIVYETICKSHESKSFENESIFIFTSPSTVECFFKSFSWKSTFKAVTIGITTAKALPKEVKYFIAKDKSIQSCIDLAKDL